MPPEKHYCDEFCKQPCGLKVQDVVLGNAQRAAGTSIPSPFMPNRMITGAQVDKIMKELGTKKIFLASIGDDRKLFMSFFGFCKHDIAAMLEVLKNSPPPDTCTDIPPQDPQMA